MEGVRGRECVGKKREVVERRTADYIDGGMSRGGRRETADPDWG
jgi:hypothetical protein